MAYIKHILNTFCMCVFSYAFLFSLLYLIPTSMQKYGVLNNQINLSHIVQSKAKSVADSMNETNLGLNFIGNFHELSPYEAQIFQSSGLVHLLAISGAQILPVVSLLCFCSSFILYYFFKNKLRPHELMKICSTINAVFSFLISLFIAILFGGTGALLRVSWLNFFRKINLLYFIQSLIFKKTAEFLEPLLDKFFILIVVSLLFGNIFTNYSFILSAIGASCAEISSYICIFIVKNKNKNSQNLFIFTKFMTSKFFLEVLVTMFTCVLVGVILSPLTYNSIINSCLANIFAIPIITFLVTPLALLVLVTPINNIIFNLLLKGLDYSLILFKHIAIVFADGDLKNNPTLQNTRLFSPDGLLYLNVTMVVLWVVVDFIRGRKIFLMRVKYQKALKNAN